MNMDRLGRIAYALFTSEMSMDRFVEKNGLPEALEALRRYGITDIASFELVEFREAMLSMRTAREEALRKRQQERNRQGICLITDSEKEIVKRRYFARAGRPKSAREVATHVLTLGRQVLVNIRDPVKRDLWTQANEELARSMVLVSVPDPDNAGAHIDCQASANLAEVVQSSGGLSKDWHLDRVITVFMEDGRMVAEDWSA